MLKLLFTHPTSKESPSCGFYLLNSLESLPLSPVPWLASIHTSSFLIWILQQPLQWPPMFVLVPVKPFTTRAFLEHDLIIAFLCLKKFNGSHHLSIKSKPIKVPVIWLPSTCPQSHLDTHSPTYIQCLWFPLFSHASVAVQRSSSPLPFCPGLFSCPDSDQLSSPAEYFSVLPPHTPSLK